MLLRQLSNMKKKLSRDWVTTKMEGRLQKNFFLRWGGCLKRDRGVFSGVWGMGGG